MTFKKLALATAIACVPMASFAVDVLDDADLASATGQDGIRIALDLDVNTDVLVHDTDGIASFDNYTGVTTSTSGGGTVTSVSLATTADTTYTFAGAIVIDGMSIDATNGGTGAADGVIVNIDAGDDDSASSNPLLNVNVSLGATSIATGNISIQNSNRDNTTGASWGAGSTGATILSNSVINLGGAQLNIQLGNEAQVDSGAATHMVAIGTNIVGGMSISGTTITDTSVGGGSIVVGNLTLKNNQSDYLSIVAYADITATGLRVQVGQLGDAQGMDVRMENVQIGGSTLGDIEMTGLNLSGTVLEISGK